MSLYDIVVPGTEEGEFTLPSGCKIDMKEYIRARCAETRRRAESERACIFDYKPKRGRSHKHWSEK